MCKKIRKRELYKKRRNNTQTIQKQRINKTENKLTKQKKENKKNIKKT